MIIPCFLQVMRYWHNFIFEQCTAQSLVLHWSFIIHSDIDWYYLFNNSHALQIMSETIAICRQMNKVLDDYDDQMIPKDEWAVNFLKFVLQLRENLGINLKQETDLTGEQTQVCFSGGLIYTQKICSIHLWYALEILWSFRQGRFSCLHLVSPSQAMKAHCGMWMQRSTTLGRARMASPTLGCLYPHG